jgi:hypothetical protein
MKDSLLRKIVIIYELVCLAYKRCSVSFINFTFDVFIYFFGLPLDLCLFRSTI